MVLNIGGGGIFPSQDLPQEYGKINERWNQEGSNIINVLGDNVQNTTIYTVSTGKRLFIKTIITDDASAAIVSAGIRDNATTKIDIHIPINVSTLFTFDVPVYFDHSVYIESDDVADVSLIGWEEDAP